MYVEHERAAWQHTAFIVSYMIEINRDQKRGSPTTPEMLNPWESVKPVPKGIPLKADNLHLMKVLAKNNGKNTKVHKSKAVQPVPSDPKVSDNGDRPTGRLDQEVRSDGSNDSSSVDEEGTS